MTTLLKLKITVSAILSFAVATLLTFLTTDAQELKQQDKKTVLIVPINGEIDSSQSALVRRCISIAKSKKVDMVIFEIDTPGGRIDYMSIISTDIMSLGNNIPTVAFIRPLGESVIPGAISAGALVSMSCKRIYMYPGTVIGAATPVMVGAGGAAAIPESYENKIISAARASFGSVAYTNGYPKSLAIAMVDPDIEVFEVTIDGKKLYLTRQEIEKYQQEGKSFEVPQYPVKEKGKPLTATAVDAFNYGIATKVINSREEIYKDYNFTNPIEIREEITWSEGLAGFITSPGISMLLLAIGIMGLWITLKMGAFGIATGVSIFCFALLFFGGYLSGLAEAPEILLVVVGIILIALEIFVIPGTGIPAILGVIFTFAGLIFIMLPGGIRIPDFEKEPWMAKDIMSAIGEVLVGFVVSLMGFLTIVRFLPNVPLFNKLVLKTELVTEGGYTAAVSGEAGLTSKVGIVVTSLRPAGKVEIDGKTIDAVADGEFINKGESVKVIQVEGTRVVVARQTS